ncbi:MAG: hypothetical protein WCO25_04395 [Candidatus Uhrbacteria bacterium]
MISLLSPSLGAKVYVDSLRSYKIGPRFCGSSDASLKRILDASPEELNVRDRPLLAQVIRVSLDLGGGAKNNWLGVSETLIHGSSDALRRLVELRVLEIEVGIVDEKSHALDRAYWPSRTLIARMVDQWPPGP